MSVFKFKLKINSNRLFFNIESSNIQFYLLTQSTGILKRETHILLKHKELTNSTLKLPNNPKLRRNQPVETIKTF